MKGIHKYKLTLIPLSLVAITLLSGYFLSHIPLGANATTSDVSLHVADTCTMNGVINEGDEHTVSLINGQERTGIGITRLTTLCNDNNGYAIYAIGYSGTTSDPHNTAGELGRTDLIGLTTGLTISTADWADRNTGDNASKSIWSMSLQDNSEVISTMKPTIENGFSNYLAVPTAYTKVASFPAATGATLATASIVNTTYAAKVAAVQSSDTYVGQVKYTMVHPSSNTATGFTFDDAFQLAGKSRVSGTSYFAMQDMNAAICNKVTELNNNFPETQLIDIRDNNIYTVKKINGDCWMTQNLRFLGNTGSAANKMVMTSNTSNGANTTLDLYSLDSSDAGNFGAYANRCDSTNGYNNACVYDSGSETTGVWYNYYAASARNISTNSNQTAVSASGPSVCPAGWHLPTGAAADTSSEFYKIFQNTTTDSWVAANDYTNAFKAVTGGSYSGGSLGNTGGGYWWSATASSATYRYALSYNGSQFGSVNGVRYIGLFVRCIADNSMQTFDSTAASSLAINESLQLRDVRDGNMYTVGKLRDGNVWLLDNLRLDIINAKIDENNTNVDAQGANCLNNGGCSSPYTTAAASSIFNYNSIDNALYNIEYSDTITTGDTQNRKYGGYYNYCAATAGTYCDPTEPAGVEPEYDICPKGWSMPKQVGQDSYKQLYAYYNNIPLFLSSYRLPFSGNFFQNNVYIQGGEARVWSSSIYQHNNQGYPHFLWLSPETIASFDVSYTGAREGNSVRCILRTE